jgi:hypothetical protein
MMTHVEVGIDVAFLHQYEEEVERELAETEEGNSIELILACEVAVNLMSKASGSNSCQSTTDLMTRHRNELIDIHNNKFEQDYQILNTQLWA